MHSDRRQQGGRRRCLSFYSRSEPARQGSMIPTRTLKDSRLLQLRYKSRFASPTPRPISRTTLAEERVLNDSDKTFHDLTLLAGPYSSLFYSLVQCTPQNNPCLMSERKRDRRQPLQITRFDEEGHIRRDSHVCIRVEVMNT